MNSSYKSHRPKKHLGQNYLIDENICRNIVDSFNIKQDDCILEIGPGTGAITKYILQKTKYFAAIELDINNVNLLSQKFSDVKIINKDFLKLDAIDILEVFPIRKNKIRIIGNIPYYITTDIMFKMVDNRDIIKDAQIMIQEEVAQRVIAKPGTKAYGILSIMLQVYSQPKLLFKVSSNCFYPKPNVDSRIIYFDFNVNLLDKISDIKFFRKFIKASFGTRRKTLRNCLKSIQIDTNKTDIDFDFTTRAESLNVEELIDLSNKLYGQINK